MLASVLGIGACYECVRLWLGKTHRVSMWLDSGKETMFCFFFLFFFPKARALRVHLHKRHRNVPSEDHHYARWVKMAFRMMYEVGAGSVGRAADQVGTFTEFDIWEQTSLDESDITSALI